MIYFESSEQELFKSTTIEDVEEMIGCGVCSGFIVESGRIIGFEE